MPNSSLAAMYNQCPLCANTTIIAFQDKNGSVQVGNLTSSGWTLTQLGPALDPEIGTGLALQPFNVPGSEDQINLYHQKSNLSMSLASWIPAGLNNGGSSVVLPPSLVNSADGNIQSRAGFSIIKSTRPSLPAHPSPPLPLIPPCPQVRKPGSKSSPSRTKVSKSTLGPGRRLTRDWNSMTTTSLRL